MDIFNISRINTDRGIFRLAGFWQPQQVGSTASTPADIRVDAIAIMCTDGWVELNRHDEKVNKLIDELAYDLHQHLLAKVTPA
jgi:hypothetical protein